MFFPLEITDKPSFLPLYCMSDSSGSPPPKSYLFCHRSCAFFDGPLTPGVVSPLYFFPGKIAFCGSPQHSSPLGKPLPVFLRFPSEKDRESPLLFFLPFFFGLFLLNSFYLRLPHTIQETVSPQKSFFYGPKFPKPVLVPICVPHVFSVNFFSRFFFCGWLPWGSICMHKTFWHPSLITGPWAGSSNSRLPINLHLLISP